jgi:hypothetical protein
VWDFYPCIRKVYGLFSPFPFKFYIGKNSGLWVMDFMVRAPAQSKPVSVPVSYARLLVLYRSERPELLLAVGGESKSAGARHRSTACRRSSSSAWRWKPPRAPARFPSSPPWILCFSLPSPWAVSSPVLDSLNRSSARDFTRQRMWSTRARYHLVLFLPFPSRFL